MGVRTFRGAPRKDGTLHMDMGVTAVLPVLNIVLKKDLCKFGNEMVCLNSLSHPFVVKISVASGDPQVKRVCCHQGFAVGRCGDVSGCSTQGDKTFVLF